MFLDHKEKHSNYELQYVWGRSTAKNLGLQSKNHVHSLKDTYNIHTYFFSAAAWHQQSQSHGNNDVREDRCRRRRIPVGNETLDTLGYPCKNLFRAFCKNQIIKKTLFLL